MCFYRQASHVLSLIFIIIGAVGITAAAGTDLAQLLLNTVICVCIQETNVSLRLSLSRLRALKKILVWCDP